MMFQIVRTWGSLFKYNCLKNKNFSLNFLFNLWNIYHILNIFYKKKIVRANVFSKLQTVKDLVRQLSEKYRFRIFLDSQHVKGSQTLVKYAWKHFYHIFSSPSGGMICKISPLFKFKIIVVFVNTLTVDAKYPETDCGNLLFPIQMQLFEKGTTFSWFFVPFLESSWNLKHFQKKEHCYS